MRLLFVLLSFAQGFLLNVPVTVFKRKYENQIVKVYEPIDMERKDMNALIFYTGANALIPGDIYSNFIKALNNYNFSVNVVPSENSATTEFLYDIRDEYKALIPLTHSSGYVNAVETINKQKKINKAVFLDPVDNSKLFDNSVFSVFSDKETLLTHLDEVLILNAGKSYKGSLFPKFEIPFIPAFGINIKKLEQSNPSLSVIVETAENYGHSDVLDTIWSDIMHTTLSKGNEIREQEVLDEYLDWLALQIYNFVNKDENKNDELISEPIVEVLQNEVEKVDDSVDDSVED